MVVATWNVNSLRVRLPQVLQWLQEQQPDVLCLQETKLPDPEFPVDALRDAGYQAAYAGQKTYNGVAVLSRAPAGEVVTDLPDLDDPQRRVLAATIDGVRVLNVYIPNGAEVDSDKYAYKLAWLRHLDDYIAAQVVAYPRLLLLGDFNIAPENEDVYDPKAWEGSVLFSEPERAAFRRLLGRGLHDTFRKFTTAPGGYTWWDYRAASFRRNHGLRIDHILASGAMYQGCTACRIDTAPRKLERPSDHAPVIAAFTP